MPISGPSKAGTAAAKTGSATGRTVMRPPWIKDDPKPAAAAAKDTPSWAKRNSTVEKASANGQASDKDTKTPPKDTKAATTKTATPEPVASKSKTPEKPAATKVAAKEPEPIKSKGKLAAKAPAVESASSSEDSSEYEYVTESETEESESSGSEAEPEAKPLPIQVKLRPVEKKAPIKLDKSASTDKAGKFVKPVLRKVAKIDEEPKPAPPPPPVIETKLKPVPKTEPLLETSTKAEQKDFRPQLKKVDSTTKRPPPPPPPPNSKFPPPPPPPPGLNAPAEFERKAMTENKKATIDKLKSRPRRRPDWSDMMKEVESGKKLRHVECNDRSKPILTCKSITNVSGQFIYETEKANVHNALLRQIQGGLRLKSVKTNDRSRPVLDGLRKFRRQMTIEEQIQKSESRAQLAQENKEAPVEESDVDDVDDIDKLRDDLQSTKQMLALEMRNKEAQDRENKRLLAKIQNLEVELSKSKKTETAGSTAAALEIWSNDALVKALKNEADESQKSAKSLEKRYQDVAEQLDAAKTEIEEQKRKIALLEKQGGSVNTSRRQSEAVPKDGSPEPDLDSDGDENEPEEKKAERLSRRLAKEVKFLKSKLGRLKDKQKACKKERLGLKDGMKKNQEILKSEKKKFKELQRDVHAMAALMHDDDEEGGEEKEDKEPENEVSDDEEDTETEESESEGEETESESEAEDAPNENKKSNYDPRIKRHEGRLAALKKGNFLLQTNVDRILDEINNIRDNSVTLQHDLDSVLSELG